MANVSSLDRLWLWWTAELAALVPARLKRMSVPSQRVVLQFTANTLELYEPKADRLKFVDRIDLSHDATDNGRMTTLLAKLPGRNRQIVLMLASKSALLRKAMFPAATEENLRAVTGFELERLTPFKAADAAFDVKLLKRVPARAEGETDQIEVAVAAAPRRLVERELGKLKAAGIKVDAVAVESDLLGMPPYLDLLPPEERAAPSGARHRAVNFGLALLALLMLLAVVVWPIWQKRERVAALIPIVERAKAGSEVAERTQRELERRVDEYNFALAKKHAQVPIIEVLEQVTKLLPLTGWVNQFEIKPTKTGRELIVQGEVAQGTKVIELFEQSGLVQNTTFKSPETRGAAPNMNRFHVAGELVAAPMPEPISDDLLVAEARAGKEDGAAVGAAPPSPAATLPPTVSNVPVQSPSAGVSTVPGASMPPPKVELKATTPEAKMQTSSGKAEVPAKLRSTPTSTIAPAPPSASPAGAPPPAKPVASPTK